MRLLIILAVCVAVIVGALQSSSVDIPQRIVGGSVTTINQYPAMAVVLYAPDGLTFEQKCGASILNNRSILTAAYCLIFDAPPNYRFRVGSSWANSGGVVHNVAYFIFHPDHNPFGYEADIAIIRSATTITFSNVVAAAYIAGTNYNAGDNAVVWTAGWGNQWPGGFFSEQLRHVQIWTINQNVCAQRYGTIGMNIPDSDMLCAGWLDVEAAGTCQRDDGGPLYHNGVVIGVISFGSGISGCADSVFPGVYVRVSSFTTWIQANA